MTTDAYLESRPAPNMLKIVEQAKRDAEAAMERQRPFIEAAREQMQRFYEETASSRNVMQQAVESFQKSAQGWQSALPKFPVLEMPEIVPTLVRPARPLSASFFEEEASSSEAVVQLPEGAAWELLHCKFKDFQTLTVLCNNKLIGHFDHAELGFARKNTKDGKPDKQWLLLQQLALLSEQWRIEPTINTIAGAMKISPGACQKVKESAAHKLCQAFGLADSPFHDYDSKLGYRLKFTLQPEPLLRGDGELHRSAGRLIERERRKARNTTHYDS